MLATCWSIHLSSRRKLTISHFLSALGTSLTCRALSPPLAASVRGQHVPLVVSHGRPHSDIMIRCCPASFDRRRYQRREERPSFPLLQSGQCPFRYSLDHESSVPRPAPPHRWTLACSCMTGRSSAGQPALSRSRRAPVAHQLAGMRRGSVAGSQAGVMCVVPT
jgi:hypothetical protein